MLKAENRPPRRYRRYLDLLPTPDCSFGQTMLIEGDVGSRAADLGWLELMPFGSFPKVSVDPRVDRSSGL